MRPAPDAMPTRSRAHALGVSLLLLAACDSGGDGPPFAVNDDMARVVAGQSVVVNVLANDTAPDGRDLDLVTVASPTCGAVTDVDEETGAVTYRPSASGRDVVCRFDYTATDGVETGTATVTIERVSAP